MSEVQESSARKVTRKSVREYEMELSDRVQLVYAANTLVHTICEKQFMPLLGNSAFAGVPELTSEESSAYNSALRFLQRQFDQGYSITEPHQKRIESEVVVVEP